MNASLVVALIFVAAGVVYGRPGGRCNMMCPMNFEPVCGTDGQTYSNQCELDAIACRNRRTVGVAYEGECVKEDDCPFVCTANYDPVCGTDGRTYGNECGLIARACRSRRPIVVAYRGRCSDRKEE